MKHPFDIFKRELAILLKTKQETGLSTEYQQTLSKTYNNFITRKQRIIDKKQNSWTEICMRSRLVMCKEPSFCKIENRWSNEKLKIKKPPVAYLFKVLYSEF